MQGVRRKSSLHQDYWERRLCRGSKMECSKTGRPSPSSFRGVLKGRAEEGVPDRAWSDQPCTSSQCIHSPRLLRRPRPPSSLRVLFAWLLLLQSARCGMVNGDTLDLELSNTRGNAKFSILFYAS